MSNIFPLDRETECSALQNSELSVSGKFQVEARDFLSLEGKLDWEELGSPAPALRLSDSRWEVTVWRLNGMTSLTHSPEGFISV